MVATEYGTDAGRSVDSPSVTHGTRNTVVSSWVAPESVKTCLMPLTVFAAEHRYAGYRISVVRGYVCVSTLNTLFGPGEDAIFGLTPNPGDAIEFALSAFAAAGVTHLPPQVPPHWTPEGKAVMGRWVARIARARREIPEANYDLAVVRSELGRLGRPIPGDL